MLRKLINVGPLAIFAVVTAASAMSAVSTQPGQLLSSAAIPERPEPSPEKSY